MHQSYSLQRLSPEHSDGWRALWNEYLVFYEATLNDTVTSSVFARLTNGDEPMGGFVAIDSRGSLLGFVHWITHRSTWTLGNYCYLQDLYVNPAGRRVGLATRLVEEVKALAVLQGCSRVYWLTKESNLGARTLYNRIATQTGFIQYKIELSGT
jgi:GNAT superfamily N-acetyltransferase